jgi:dehydrogenase/reductase SDR family member 1
VAVICDHSVESSVVSLFREIWEQEGRLDIFVNAVYPYFRFKRNYPSSLSGRTPLNVAFWDLPLAYWDELQIRSLRACYMTLWYAAPYFVKQQSGLIALLSSQGAVEYSFNVPYGVDKAGIEKIAADAALDLATFNVTTIAIRPPLTRTEIVAAAATREGLEISKARSPVYTGRVLAALAADPDIMAYSGSACEVIELAKLYGIADEIDNE